MNLNTDFTELKEKVTPVNTVKFLLGTLISVGAGMAVSMALKGSVQASRGLTKLMMKVGIFVLGCKAGDVAERYFSQTVDDLMKSLKDLQEEDNNAASPDQ